MGLFSKETDCPYCTKIVLKKTLVVYSPTKQDKKLGYKDERMCRDCALDKFYNSLLNFDEQLSLVEPIKSEAYVKCDIDKILKKKNDEGSITLAEGFISTLPTEGTQCNKCNKEARHSFCSSEIIFNDPYRWEFNYNGSYVHLCAECLVNAFKDVLKQKNIKIREVIVPPITGRGFMFGWGF